MGGHDPYSSSKGCAELVTAAWRRSFFLSTAQSTSDWDRHGPATSSAAAIGRAIDSSRIACGRSQRASPLSFGNPPPCARGSTCSSRCRAICRSPSACRSDPQGFGEAWNFGPATDEARPVAWVVDRLSRFWGDGARWEPDRGTHPHEAGLLQVDASKARARLRLDTAPVSRRGPAVGPSTGTGASEPARTRLP